MSFFIDLKKNIPNWTTESEDTLIRNLKLFSDSYSQKTDELSNNIKSLKTELTKIEINYNSNLNLLKNLSIKKFIEHSIGNEKVDEYKLEKTKRESTFLTKEQREEVLRRKYKEAFSITLGNLSISDSNKNQVTSRKDEYDDNDNASVSSSRIFDGTGKSKLGIKLPFVIGSEGFYKHDFLGVWNSEAVLKSETKQTEVVVVEEKVKISENHIKSEKTSLLTSKNQNEEVSSNKKASQIVNIDNPSVIVVNNNNKNANIPNVPSISFPIVKKKEKNDTVSEIKTEISSPKKENKMDFRAELMMRFNKGNNEKDNKVMEVNEVKEEESKVNVVSEDRVLSSTENKKIIQTNINPIISLQSKRTFFDEEEDEKEADKKGLFTMKDNKDSKDNKENKKASLFTIPEKEDNQQKEVKKKENMTNIKSNLLKMFEDDENEEEDDEELIKIRSQTIKNKINSILDNKKKDEITIIKTNTALQSTNQRTSIQQEVSIKTQPQPQVLLSQKEKEEEQKKKRKFFEEDDEKEEKEMKKEEKIHQSSVFDKEKKAVKRISLQDEVFLKKLNDQSLFPQTGAPKKMSMSNKNVSVQIEEDKVSESIRQVDIQQQKRVINKKKPGKKDMNTFDEVKEKKEENKENKGKVDKEESVESKNQPIEVKKQHQDILKEKLTERKKIMFNFDE